MKRLLLIAAAALSVSGCSTLNGIIHPSTATQLTEAKALTLANTALDEAAKAVEQANNAGLLSASNKALAKTILDKASAALDAADTAEHAGSAADVATQLALFSSLISQINTLIHGA